MDETTPKPGWKSSEFWLALVFQILPVLVIIGIVTTEEADTLAQAITQAVAAVGALVAAMLPIIRYIDSRKEVKVATAIAMAEIAVADAQALKDSLKAPDGTT